MARAEYHGYICRLGGAIVMNLAEDAYQSGISYGPNVVFQQPVKPTAGQVLRALVVIFRLVDARRDPGIDELPGQPDGGLPATSVTRDISCSRSKLSSRGDVLWVRVITAERSPMMLDSITACPPVLA